MLASPAPGKPSWRGREWRRARPPAQRCATSAPPLANRMQPAPAGVGLDFNTDLVDRVSKVRGANWHRCADAACSTVQPRRGGSGVPCCHAGTPTAGLHRCRSPCAACTPPASSKSVWWRTSSSPSRRWCSISPWRWQPPAWPATTAAGRCCTSGGGSNPAIGSRLAWDAGAPVAPPGSLAVSNRRRLPVQVPHAQRHRADRQRHHHAGRWQPAGGWEGQGGRGTAAGGLYSSGARMKAALLVPLELLQPFSPSPHGPTCHPASSGRSRRCSPARRQRRASRAEWWVPRASRARAGCQWGCAWRRSQAPAQSHLASLSGAPSPGPPLFCALHAPPRQVLLRMAPPRDGSNTALQLAVSYSDREGKQFRWAGVRGAGVRVGRVRDAAARLQVSAGCLPACPSHPPPPVQALRSLSRS